MADREHSGLDLNASPPDFLRGAQQLLGDTEYVARIQTALRLPRRRTTTALQALVTSGCQRFITTNLDSGVENAFRMAGRPLSASAIGYGYSAEELSIFDRLEKEPILLKIHGSLERPGSWVLTSEDYDQAYVRSGALEDFLSVKVHTPLFIGFSFTDMDIGQSLRLGRLNWKNRAFALISDNKFRKDAERLKTLGVIPIPFYQYEHIPEILDEIFQCSPLAISFESGFGEKRGRLRIGAAQIEAQAEKVGWSAHPASQESIVEIIANALELQPNTSFLDQQPRRQHSTRGRYLELLKGLVRKADAEAIGMILEALSQYSDVLVDGLCRPLVRKYLSSEQDIFWFLRLSLATLRESKGAHDRRLVQLLLSEMQSLDLYYPALRAIAKVLALEGLHPAQQVPPVAVRVGKYKVPSYPLTESQVATLRGEGVLANRSARPYLVDGLAEIAELIDRLREQTGEEWRLPSEAEWREIAGLDQDAGWPWGKEKPTYRIHAHLRFHGKKGQLPGHPLEVGLFPRGRSRDGVWDLIGNIHELVVRKERIDPDVFLARGELFSDYKLAGGSWTTKEYPATRFQIFSGMGTPKRNTGIRPVVELDD